MRARTTVDLLQPATKVDPYSPERSIPDWLVPPTTHAGVPAAVDPVQTGEATGASAAVTDAFVCYLAAGTVVDDTWRVVWRGTTYAIDGDVTEWVGSRRSYIVLQLKEVSG